AGAAKVSDTPQHRLPSRTGCEYVNAEQQRVKAVADQMGDGGMAVSVADADSPTSARLNQHQGCALPTIGPIFLRTVGRDDVRAGAEAFEQRRHGDRERSPR